VGVKAWNLIKKSKNFYVRTYRGAETAIVFSILLNVGFGAGLLYEYSIRPQPDYYTTFGETPPVPLISMEEPNYSSTPLLPDDANQDNEAKDIPN
jgi:intracellular multiplication protein IcmM